MNADMSAREAFFGDAAYSHGEPPRPPSRWLVSIIVTLLIILWALCQAGAATAASDGPGEPRTFEPSVDLVWVEDSPGGSVEKFMLEIDAISKMNPAPEVRIAGKCASSCTLFTRLPRVCVERGARLGFHSPFRPGSVQGVRSYERSYTRQFTSMYPANIQRWISRQGGLQPGIVWVSGRALHRLVPPCKGRPLKH